MSKYPFPLQAAFQGGALDNVYWESRLDKQVNNRKETHLSFFCRYDSQCYLRVIRFHNGAELIKVVPSRRFAQYATRELKVPMVSGGAGEYVLMLYEEVDRLIATMLEHPPHTNEYTAETFIREAAGDQFWLVGPQLFEIGARTWRLALHRMGITSAELAGCTVYGDVVFSVSKEDATRIRDEYGADHSNRLAAAVEETVMRIMAGEAHQDGK